MCNWFQYSILTRFLERRNYYDEVEEKGGTDLNVVSISILGETSTLALVENNRISTSAVMKV